MWANPTEFGGAVENSAGFTYVYVNGKLNNTLQIGNSTLNFFINYLKLMHEFSPQPYAYVNWSHYVIVVHHYSNSTFETVALGQWNSMRTFNYIANNYLSLKAILSPTFPIAIGLLLSLSFSETPLWLGLLLNVKFNNTTFYISQNYEFSTLQLQLWLSIGYKSFGQIYISYLNYPLPIQIPLVLGEVPNPWASTAINTTALTLRSLGFIFNYSSYYGVQNE